MCVCSIKAFTLLLPYFQRTFAFTLEDIVSDKVTNLLDPFSLTLFYYLRTTFFNPFFIWECKDKNIFYSANFIVGLF
jgi:hypothetical protein